MEEIRLIQKGELEQVAEIAKERIYSFLSLEEIKNWLGSMKFPYLQIFVADNRLEANLPADIVGFISWRLYDQSVDKVVLEIFWMAIKEQFQETGIGKDLFITSFKRVRDYWESRGKTVSAILVAPYEKREGAQRFFEKILRPSHKALIPDVWGTEFTKQGIIVMSKILSNQSELH